MEAISKAQTIRDALKANPTLSPSEIAAKLGGGITGQYVSLIRYQDKKSAGKKTAKRKARKTASTVARTISPKQAQLGLEIAEKTGQLGAAREFVQQCGSFEAASAAVKYLESLQVK